jgi:hypothetical protein
LHILKTPVHEQFQESVFLFILVAAVPVDDLHNQVKVGLHRLVYCAAVTRARASGLVMRPILRFIASQSEEAHAVQHIVCYRLRAT